MSAFKVFLEHWLVEENRAKKTNYYKKIGEKIRVSVEARESFLVFEELLQAWEIPGLRSHELLGKIIFRGMVLAMFSTVIGDCKVCRKSVVRFEVYRQVHLVAICQNDRCAHVQFFFEDLFA